MQALKESPTRSSQLYQGTSKITMAHDAIQAIKQLRRDVVDAMRALMKLAKEKQTSGMLPICEDMITKTRILLSLWDPGLVEEALTFLEEFKVAKVQGDTNEDTLNLDFKTNQSLSPFKRITQQLNFDLKSPDFDDFVTPDTPECVRDMWTRENERNSYATFPKSERVRANAKSVSSVSEDATEENFVIFPGAENDVGKDTRNANDSTSPSDTAPDSAPDTRNDKDNDNGGDVDGDNETNNDNANDRNVATETEDNEEREEIKGDIDPCKRFLDTQKMCNSPSANYYKPTDEPEPWDLTQLNIEASVMCLVSKVKFLCGRCSSPAVRLRNRNTVGRSHSLKGRFPTDRNKNAQVVTIQPKNDVKPEESSKLLESLDNRVNSRQHSSSSPNSSPSPGTDKTTPAFSKAKEGKELQFCNSNAILETPLIGKRTSLVTLLALTVDACFFLSVPSSGFHDEGN